MKLCSAQAALVSRGARPTHMRTGTSTRIDTDTKPRRQFNGRWPGAYGSREVADHIWVQPLGAADVLWTTLQ